MERRKEETLGNVVLRYLRLAGLEGVAEPVIQKKR